MDSTDNRKWTIKVMVPDINNFTIDLQFNPLMTIGSVVVELSAQLRKKISVNKYDLWNPLKNEWITNKRQTLVGYDLKNESVVHLIKSWINLNIILPSLEIVVIEAFNTIKQICEKLQLRCFEEFSLRKFQKASDKVLFETCYPINESAHHLDNPNYAKYISSRINYKMNRELEKEFPDGINEQYRWCNFYNSWIDTHKTLKQQGIEENDTLMLRFKYYKFLDHDKKVELPRITQIFMQAFWAIRTQEITVPDDSLTHFAAMAWHIFILKNKEIYISGDDANDDLDDDDIDAAIERLESKLERDYSRLEQSSGVTTNMVEEFEVIKCSNSKVKLKMNQCSLKGTRLRVIHLKESNVEFFEMEMKGAKIKWLIKPSKDVYRIIINQFPENLTDKCTFKSITLQTPNAATFISWLPAFRYACKNISVNHPYYDLSAGCTKALVKLKYSCEENPTKSQNPEVANYITIDEFFPKNYFKKRSRDEVSDQLFFEQENCFKLNLEDTMLSFIRKWMGIKHFDMVTLTAIFPKEELSKKEEIVGISTTSFCRMNPKTGEVVKEWPLSKLKQWSINWSNKQEVLKFSDESIYVALPNCEVNILHEYVGGYIFMHLRKDSSDAIDTAMWNKLTSSQ